MKKHYPRRNFVRTSFLVSGGLLLFSPGQGLAKSTTNRKTSLSDFSKADIRQKLFGKQISISGQVFDETGKKPLSGAILEFWHLSPNSKHTGHSGKILTDNKGHFKISSDYPNREEGRAPTVHFKVSKNGKEYETQLKFNDYGAHITSKHWEANNGLPEKLLFPTMEKSFNRTKINFNFSINNI